MVSIQASEMQMMSAQTSSYHGIDLVCLLDHHGSMSKDRLELAKAKLKQMFLFLGPMDRLCLISLEKNLFKATRLLKVTEENIQKFISGIDSLQVQDGGADFEKGINKAIAILKQIEQKNDISAIFILSGTFNPIFSVDNFNNRALERLDQISNSIDRSETLRIHLFDLSNNICQKDLPEITQFKGGKFYFVQNLSFLGEYLIDSLGGLKSLISKNVRITLRFEGPCLIKTYGNKWKNDAKSQVYCYDQCELLAGNNLNILLEVKNANYQNEEWSANIEIEILANREENKFSYSSTLSSNNQNEQQSKKIIANLMRVRIAETLNQVLQYCENGNFLQGLILIDQQLNNLKMTKMEDAIISTLIRDLEVVKNYCNPKNYFEKAKTLLIVLSETHMNQQSRGHQISAGDSIYENNIQKEFQATLKQMIL